jgi:large repetitive protein
MRRLSVTRRASGLALIIAAASLAAVGSSAVLSSTSAAAADSGLSASYIATGQREFTVAVDATTNMVYLGGYGTDVLSVVNGATNELVTSFQLGGDVAGIAVDAPDDLIYATVVSDSFTGIDVISGASNTITSTFSQPEGSSPDGIAVDPSTGTLYESISGGVDILDAATGAVRAVVTLHSGARPASIAFDSSSDVAWVVDQSGYVDAISGATDALQFSVPLPMAGAGFLAVDDVTNTVYVPYQGINVVNGADGTLTNIAVPGTTYAVAVNPADGNVYASGSTGTSLISGSTIVDTIGTRGSSVAFDPANGDLYEAGDDGADGASAIEPATANAESPLVFTQSATLNAGIFGSVSIVGSAEPAAEYTESGTLPAGVTLSSAGVISGTPAAGTGGAYPVTLTASNGVAPAYTETLTIDVDQMLEIAGAAAATFQVGTPGSYPFQVTGYPQPTLFSFLGPGPAGLSIQQVSAGNWEISGTPLPGSGGTYGVEIESNTTVSGFVSMDVTLTVNEAPSITSATHATFRTGVSGSFTVGGNGYPKPTYSEAGKLPSGVTLSSAGVLSGKPTAKAGGKYLITVTARNALASATQAFTLTVDQAPAFTSAASATFKAGSKHTFTFRTSGYPAAKLSRSGSLPKGVTFKAGSNGTATLTGEAPRADQGKTYVLKISASNGVVGTVHQTFRLKIS